MNTLIPDWEAPKSIGLVWPEDLEDFRTRCLTNCFYMILIRLLLDTLHKDITLTIIHRKGEKERLQNYYSKDRVRLIQNNKIQDIWIRDFAPFWKRSNNKSVAIKAKYQPGYMGDVYEKKSKYDDAIGTRIGGANIEQIHIKGSREDYVILDGGNLTHNGAGTAIISNRIISDNEHYFIEDIMDAVKKACGLERIILIPAEWGDDTGHVDGMVRFLSGNEVIVSEYRYKWEKGLDNIDKEDYDFEKYQLNKLAKFLENEGFVVHRMPNGIPKQNDEFESAEGNYTNFLRVEDKIFLPQYGVKEQDRSAIKALVNAGIKEENIFPIPDCNELAELGGVLNCITTHIY